MQHSHSSAAGRDVMESGSAAASSIASARSGAIAVAAARQRAGGAGEASATTRVAFTISAREWQLFLPGLTGGGMEALGATWVDTEALRGDDWERMLRDDLRPDAIVTAWSTPALPPQPPGEAELPLRFVAHITGSVRKLVPRRYIERGLLVTNWGASISHTIAEHAMLLVLAALRNLPAWGNVEDSDDGCVYEKLARIRPKSLRGRRVGLHGFGAIAREIAGMLRAFGADVSAWSAGVPRSLYEEFGVRPSAGLKELFAGSEVLIECEGLTPDSRGMVTAELLELLPEDAVFVNVGRAGVTDEEALARMVRTGRLRAGLDVYSPVVGTVGGGILSPHIAGPTLDTCPACGDNALRNLEAYLRGEMPAGLMTLEVYDRST
ncbi:phosphoglycerate dehydrogenase [Verrucomicrobia bacterium LW23]|nr:phosphoglycerate dehydrogenase [Verrucomicrobia bacterium LW23]